MLNVLEKYCTSYKRQCWQVYTLPWLYCLSMFYHPLTSLFPLLLSRIVSAFHPPLLSSPVHLHLYALLFCTTVWLKWTTFQLVTIAYIQHFWGPDCFLWWISGETKGILLLIKRVGGELMFPNQRRAEDILTCQSWTDVFTTKKLRRPLEAEHSIDHCWALIIHFILINMINVSQYSSLYCCSPRVKNSSRANGLYVSWILTVIL